MKHLEQMALKGAAAVFRPGPHDKQEDRGSNSWQSFPDNRRTLPSRPPGTPSTASSSTPQKVPVPSPWMRTDPVDETSAMLARGLIFSAENPDILSSQDERFQRAVEYDFSTLREVIKTEQHRDKSLFLCYAENCAALAGLIGKARKDRFQVLMPQPGSGDRPHIIAIDVKKFTKGNASLIVVDSAPAGDVSQQALKEMERDLPSSYYTVYISTNQDRSRPIGSHIYACSFALKMHRFSERLNSLHESAFEFFSSRNIGYPSSYSGPKPYQTIATTGAGLLPADFFKHAQSKRPIRDVIDARGEDPIVNSQGLSLMERHVAKRFGDPGGDAASIDEKRQNFQIRAIAHNLDRFFVEKVMQPAFAPLVAALLGPLPEKESATARAVPERPANTSPKASAWMNLISELKSAGCLDNIPKSAKSMLSKSAMTEGASSDIGPYFPKKGRLFTNSNGSVEVAPKFGEKEEGELMPLNRIIYCRHLAFAYLHAGRARDFLDGALRNQQTLKDFFSREGMLRRATLFSRRMSSLDLHDVSYISNRNLGFWLSDLANEMRQQGVSEAKVLVRTLYHDMALRYEIKKDYPWSPERHCISAYDPNLDNHKRTEKSTGSLQGLTLEEAFKDITYLFPDGAANNMLVVVGCEDLRLSHDEPLRYLDQSQILGTVYAFGQAISTGHLSVAMAVADEWTRTPMGSTRIAEMLSLKAPDGPHFLHKLIETGRVESFDAFCNVLRRFGIDSQNVAHLLQIQNEIGYPPVYRAFEAGDAPMVSAFARELNSFGIKGEAAIQLVRAERIDGTTGVFAACALAHPAAIIAAAQAMKNLKIPLEEANRLLDPRLPSGQSALEFVSDPVKRAATAKALDDARVSLGLKPLSVQQGESSAPSFFEDNADRSATRSRNPPAARQPTNNSGFAQGSSQSNPVTAHLDRLRQGSRTPGPNQGYGRRA
jgi:hypothetical protein